MKALLPALGLMIILGMGTGTGTGTGTMKSIESGARTNWNNEIIYHVMPRSFCDSNGDRHGDLKGFTGKLDYLVELGITAILFTPLYESGFYHNYFPTDYCAIDQEYGTMNDYIAFVRAVHEKGLKFIMDMETQYVQNGHIWFDSTYASPGSRYDDYVYYSDSLNRYPAQLFFPTGTPLFDYLAWPGDTSFNIATLDLRSEVMHRWQKEFYSFWVDPDRDGDFSDGVDGFRIDHLMDDLDDKGIFTNLYRDFWKPIFDTCRSINPDIFVVGEQANWAEYGDELVERSTADAAFNFPLKFALRGTSHGHAMSSDMTGTGGWSIEPARVHVIMEACLDKFGPDHFFVNFIENHDTDRFASIVEGDDRMLKLAAVLLATFPGTPSIYYGQELGLPGVIGDYGSDANHIPIREAFPWDPNVDGEGIAAFYRDTGPWWDNSFYHTSRLQSLALSSQNGDPNSLLNHYRFLLMTRQNSEALRLGDYCPMFDRYTSLLAFSRNTSRNSCIVITNPSPTDVLISIDAVPSLTSTSPILSYGIAITPDSIQLSPYAFAIYNF